MNNFDNNISNLNEIIEEIKNVKSDIYNNNNKLVNLDELLVIDATLFTGALFASAISCSILKLTSLIPTEKLVASQATVVGGTILCSSIYTIFKLLNNQEIKKNIQEEEKTLKYLEDLYQEKTDKFREVINSQSDENKRILKKDN